MFDAQLYRDKAEVEAWQKRGPIIMLTTLLKAAGLMTEEDFQRLQREADAEVSAGRRVSPSVRMGAGRGSRAPRLRGGARHDRRRRQRITYREALKQAIREALPSIRACS